MLKRVIAQLKNKRIVVLGAGLTGISCVRFLAKHALVCHLNDSRESVINAGEFLTEFPQCSLTLGQWNKDQIEQAEVILLSPGIDVEKEQLDAVISDNCLVMGDVELFCQITDVPIIAATGSNGKSTLVTLLKHIGDKLGKNVVLGGNIGEPVLNTLTDKASAIDGYILELSSFQLETLHNLNAVAGTVLNVSDDHLDRHKTLKNYSEIKQKIYQQSYTAVINRDDKFSHATVDINIQPVISFGSDPAKDGEFGITRIDGQSYLMFEEKELISVNELPLAGIHNAMNFLAALALGRCLGWNIESMVKCFASFEGLEHRCQRIHTQDNITWINDSKATNIGATIAAIKGLSATFEQQKNDLILIAGGDGKGADFKQLSNVIDENVSVVITLGKDGHKIAALAKNSVQVNSLHEAVNEANAIANAGDIVLLSPACASIDMFRNFVERGHCFVESVNALQEAC